MKTFLVFLLCALLPFSIAHADNAPTPPVTNTPPAAANSSQTPSAGNIATQPLESFIQSDANANAPMPPFGANLFINKPAPPNAQTANPDYRIAPGDTIAVKMWGGNSFDGSMPVDNQGNIFLPDVGPVNVQDVRQADLNSVVSAKAAHVYKSNVGIYTALQGSLPVSVFVAGTVLSPGHYSGTSTDSIIDYLSRAGGIDPLRGSYRTITVIRNNKPLQNFDTYDFLRKGMLPEFRLREGDTILVTPRGNWVSVRDGALSLYSFEFPPEHKITGADIADLATPLPGTANVLIEGMREGKPFKSVQALADFAPYALGNADEISFVRGEPSDKVAITIGGMHLGPRRMVVPKDTHLKEVLSNIPVNTMSDTGSIFIRRRSVAAKQKGALQESLQRLEETMLLARTAGVTTTQTPAISDAEAKILDTFIARAGAVQPDGRVVVTRNHVITDIALEEGDEIVIPQKTDVVTVNGEVMVPQAVVWHSGDSVMDYIDKTGGFTDRANHSQIVVITANGGTEIGTDVSVEPGDEIVVLPEVKLNSLELTGTVVDIIYKATVAAAIPFAL